MSHNPAPRHFGRRGLIATATAIGVVIGAAGLAGAAQSVLHLDSHSSAGLSGSLGVDDSVDATVDASVDVTVDDTTDVTVDDNGTDSTVDDNATDDNGTDDNGVDDNGVDGTDTTIDDNGNDTGVTTSGTGSIGLGISLPEAFTKTYTTAGGSITVAWTGTAFVLQSVNAAAGFATEIKDQAWDRIRVEFRGSIDTRIEVRLSDDTNTIQVRID